MLITKLGVFVYVCPVYSVDVCHMIFLVIRHLYRINRVYINYI